MVAHARQYHPEARQHPALVGQPCSFAPFLVSTDRSPLSQLWPKVRALWT